MVDTPSGNVQYIRSRSYWNDATKTLNLISRGTLRPRQLKKWLVHVRECLCLDDLRNRPNKMANASCRSKSTR